MNKKIIAAKLGFLLLTIAIASLFPVFKKPPPPRPKENQTSGEILSKKTDQPKTDGLPQVLSKTTSWANQTKDEIVQATSDFIGQTASAAASTVSSLIYDTTIKPIVDKIEKLPPDQQEKVKEQVCKWGFNFKENIAPPVISTLQFGGEKSSVA